MRAEHQPVDRPPRADQSRGQQVGEHLVVARDGLMSNSGMRKNLRFGIVECYYSGRINGSI